MKKTKIIVVLSIMIVVCCIGIIVMNNEDKESVGNNSTDNKDNIVLEHKNKDETDDDTCLENQDSTTEFKEDKSDVQSTEKEPHGFVQKLEASYEEWIAAAMVVAVSMQYPDFESEEIYVTGATDFEKKNESNGVYIVFSAEGETMAFHSFPIKEERTEKGTMDISTMDMGFITFDAVDEKEIPKSQCRKIVFEELEDLIKQSLLVTIHER